MQSARPSSTRRLDATFCALALAGQKTVGPHAYEIEPRGQMDAAVPHCAAASALATARWAVLARGPGALFLSSAASSDRK